eukprot:6485047-Amphidinium_carterae.4
MGLEVQSRCSSNDDSEAKMHMCTSDFSARLQPFQGRSARRNTMTDVRRALLWVAEYDPKSLRLRLPCPHPVPQAGGSGRALQSSGRVRFPQEIVQDACLPPAHKFQRHNVQTIGLLSVVPGQLWDEFMQPSAAVTAQLHYETADLIFWRPVDAHIVSVVETHCLDIPHYFSNCWRQDGLQGAFSAKQRLFTPVVSASSGILDADCGPLTVRDVCLECGAELSSIKGVLLPHPLGSLLLQRKVTELVLYARWYANADKNRLHGLDRLFSTWPPENWLTSKRQAIHRCFRSLSEFMQVPPKIGPSSCLDLLTSLRSWSSTILASAGRIWKILALGTSE